MQLNTAAIEQLYTAAHVLLDTVVPVQFNPDSVVQLNYTVPKSLRGSCKVNRQSRVPQTGESHTCETVMRGTLGT